MRFGVILLTLVVTFLSSFIFVNQTNTSIETIERAYEIGHVDLKLRKLIVRRVVKGGGIKGSLFEVDSDRLLLICRKWSTGPSRNKVRTKAYAWNGRRWRRIRVKIQKFDVQEGEKIDDMTCGVFGFGRKLCIDNKSVKSMNMHLDKDFVKLCKKHNLQIVKEEGFNSRKLSIWFHFGFWI